MYVSSQPNQPVVFCQEHFRATCICIWHLNGYLRLPYCSQVSNFVYNYIFPTSPISVSEFLHGIAFIKCNLIDSFDDFILHYVDFLT